MDKILGLILAGNSIRIALIVYNVYCNLSNFTGTVYIIMRFILIAVGANLIIKVRKEFEI